MRHSQRGVSGAGVAVVVCVGFLVSAAQPCSAEGYRFVGRIGLQHQFTNDVKDWRPGKVWNPQVGFVDADGQVYLQDEYGCQKYDRNGQCTGGLVLIIFNMRTMTPRGLTAQFRAFGPDGSLYFIVDGQDPSSNTERKAYWLAKGDFDGAINSSWGIACPTGLKPQHVFVHDNDDVSITYSDNNSVARFTAEGKRLAFATSQSFMGQPSGWSYSMSAGPLFDSQGRPYTCGREITRYTPELVPDMVWRPLGGADGNCGLLRIDDNGTIHTWAMPSMKGAPSVRWIASFDEQGKMIAQSYLPASDFFPRYMDASGNVYCTRENGKENCFIYVFAPQ